MKTTKSLVDRNGHNSPQDAIDNRGVAHHEPPTFGQIVLIIVGVLLSVLEFQW